MVECLSSMTQLCHTLHLTAKQHLIIFKHDLEFYWYFRDVLSIFLPSNFHMLINVANKKNTAKQCCWHNTVNSLSDVLWLLSPRGHYAMMLCDVCCIHPVSGRRVQPAGCMAHIGWSGPAWPAWLKAATAGFLCRPGRGISCGCLPTAC